MTSEEDAEDDPSLSRTKPGLLPPGVEAVGFWRAVNEIVSNHVRKTGTGPATLIDGPFM